MLCACHHQIQTVQGLTCFFWGSMLAYLSGREENALLSKFALETFWISIHVMHSKSHLGADWGVGVHVYSDGCAGFFWPILWARCDSHYVILLMPTLTQCDFEEVPTNQLCLCKIRERVSWKYVKPSQLVEDSWANVAVQVTLAFKSSLIWCDFPQTLVRL